MSRQLSSAANLDNVKREAKRWLKALRSGDEQARERLRRAYPQVPESRHCATFNMRSPRSTDS